VLLRKADGEVVALSNLCPHRFASLSSGRWIDGERLQCPYHGLEFDASGQCVHNPHGAVPRAARLRRYPVVERHTAIWLWVGAEENADPDLIPDFSLLSSPTLAPVRGRLEMDVNYELITDNLMDLSHVAFVHSGGIGSDAIADGQHTVEQKGTTVFSNRWCPDGAPAPAWATLMNYEDNVDHWMNMRWDAPSTMWLDIGVTPAGRHRDEGITIYNVHFLTPKTENSSHYLWAAARNYSLEDKEIDAFIRTSITHAFMTEDHPMIEDVQRNMQGRRFSDMKPLLLPFDEGAVRARRVLDDIRSGRKRQQRPVAE
jgi:phenylpropionate dioxygenase-like ring-hydroxylating dioxygenase large terminal subunit